MPAAAGIEPGDWDLLFRAALERLARVAVETPVSEGTGARWQAPGTVLRECLEALDRLRRSAPQRDSTDPLHAFGLDQGGSGEPPQLPP